MINHSTASVAGTGATKAELHQLRNLLNSSLDVICSIDADGCFVYASAAAEKIWGYKPEELTGKKYIDLVVEEDRPKTIAAAEAIMSGINVTNFENRYIRKDESFVPIVWSATWNEQEKIMYCVAKDATEKKELEKSIFKSKALFETFMSNSPLVGWITDENCIMHYMNPIYLKTYGFTENDYGKSIYDIFPKQIAVDYHINNLKVIKEGKAIQIIEKGLTENGKEQVLKIFKFPLQIDGVNMVAGWAVDITEETELQHALTKSVERYHYVNEATSDAIYDWDVWNNKMYRGSGFETIFGYIEKKISIKGRLILLHPDDRERYKSVVFAALRDSSNNKWRIEYRLKDASGKYRNVVDKAYIIKNGGRAVRVIGAIQDVSQQKELQKKLIEQEKATRRKVVKSIIETQEKERRQLSVELHDNVNQMLASCKLMLEFATQDKENAAILTQKSYVSLQLVIDEIRKISHDLNPSVLEDIGLKESIEQMIEKINCTGKLHIGFKYETEHTSSLSNEDKTSVYRIIQEQVNNILKHAHARNAFINLTIDDNEVKLSIKDDGIGYDANKIKKGLGLKNIHNRVEYYHGTINLQSEPDKGSSMDIVLHL